MFWSLAQQVGRQASNYIVFAVLAILLSPHEFGLVALATAWLAFIAVFSELGFGVALIQRENLESRHLSSTFAMNMVVGLGLSVAGVAASWPIAALVRTPELQPVMAVLSISFIINALSFTQTALAQREFRFRELAVRDVAASLSGGTVGIALAAFGAKTWSLVAQSMVASTVAAALLWRSSRWRPRLEEVSLAHVKELWHYSSRILTYNAFKYLVQNVDQLIIGYLMGPIALGAYVFAAKVVLTPMTSLRGAFGAYLFPKFSRLQSDARAVSASYELFMKIIAACVMPAMAAVAVAGPLVIALLFGDKWSAAAPLVQIFTLVAVAQALIAPVGELMKALNRPGWLLGWAVCLSAMIAACVTIGASRGTLGAAAGLAAAHALALPINYVILRRLISTSLASVARTALAPAVAGVGLAAATYLGLKAPLEYTSLRIAFALLVGTAVYGFLLAALDKEFVLTMTQRLQRAHRAARA